jgi:predicted deacylase
MSTIDDVEEVEKGVKKSGTVKVAERSVFDIEIPITVINGIKDGPTLFVIAGEHPNEYAGIETCIRLARNLNPQEISGRLVIIPIINIPGFLTRSQYVNPIDHVNLFTIWPGKEKDASISYVMVYNLYHKLIKKADYLLDLHGGDICESMIPCVYAPIVGDNIIDEENRKLAKVFAEAGFNFMVEWISLKKEEELQELVILLSKQGKPSLIAEAGAEGKVEEKDVKMLYNGVINVMKHLGMIQGEPNRITKPKLVGREGKNTFVSSSRGGLFYSFVKVGDVVSKGDILGEIRNVWGETIERIVAPHDGMIFFKINTLPWDPSLGWFLFNVVDIS